LALVLLFLAAILDYKVALPGYHYQFPRDHFNHPEFRTEWWYYTGNVRARDGHRYGFELVFFRQGQDRKPDNPSVWRVDDLYLAHLALTDIDAGRFRYYKRLNRAGPGIAGVSFQEGRIWNGNWQVRWDKASDVQSLSAVADGVSFSLRLTPVKPPVINGVNGVSQKAAGAGKASYYVSFPRLAVEGLLDGAEVAGSAWMDHEWFTQQLDASQQGWDWFSVQLANGADLMLFDLRRTDGATDPYSSGTYIAPDGRATHLQRADFTPAAGVLDESQDGREVSREVADFGSIEGRRAGVRRRGARAGVSLRRRFQPDLLGGRGDLLRLVGGRGLSGDDGVWQGGEVIGCSPALPARSFSTERPRA
jgi:predicted secreted hydrolase